MFGKILAYLKIKKKKLFIMIFLSAIFVIPISNVSANTVLDLGEVTFGIETIKDVKPGVSEYTYQEIHDILLNVYETQDDFDYYYIMRGHYETQLLMFNEGDVDDIEIYFCGFSDQMGFRSANNKPMLFHEYKISTNSFDTRTLPAFSGFGGYLIGCPFAFPGNTVPSFEFHILTNYEGMNIKINSQYTKYDTILINDIPYYKNGLIPIPVVQEEIEIPLDFKTNNQIFSIDFKPISSVPFDLEVDVYLEDTDKGFILNGFKNLSLYKDSNDLYHWETNNNCVVDGDYNVVNNGNRYRVIIKDVTCNWADGALENYFKIELKNAISYSHIHIRKGEQYFHFLNTLDSRYIKQNFTTSDFDHINFSTSLEHWNEINAFYFNGSGFNVNTFDFDTKNYQLKINRFVVEEGLFQLDNLTRSNISFGRANKTGFSVLKTDDTSEIITLYYLPSLYYNYSFLNAEREVDIVVVDENGESDVIGNIIAPPKDIKFNFDNSEDIFNSLGIALDNFASFIKDFSSLVTLFFEGLPTPVQVTIITIFLIMLSLGVIMWLKG